MAAPAARFVYPGEKYYPPGVRWDAPIKGGTLPDLLDESAALFTDRVAIEFRGRPLLFRDFAQVVDAMAAALLAAGYGPGSSVGLFLGNTPDHPISFFGVLKAGARLVHLSPLDGERALTHKLRDSGARVVVTSDLATLLPTAIGFLDKGLVDLVIVCSDEAWGGNAAHALMPLPGRPDVISFRDFIADAQAPSQWPKIEPDDIALLQYTGGTTGLPKGAMLSHNNLTSSVSIYEVWWAYPPLADKVIDRIICVLPLFHIYALTVILLRCIKMGDVMSLHQRFDPAAVLDDIEINRATSFPGVPTMWIAIANDPTLAQRDLSSLTICNSGGAPLPVEVARIIKDKTGHLLRSGWGMTETCSPGTAHPAEGPDKPASIGLMLPGIELDVVALDDRSRVLAAGEVGEIRIRGPNVTRGYWNRPDATAEAFVGDRFLTGDIGYMDEDGYFYLVDRKTDLIISGGFNIYPQMIEQAIYEHPSVREALVIGAPDDYRGEVAVAYVSLRADAEPFSIEDLRAFLSGKLGRHELPAAVTFMEELPRTPVGKLSRHLLRQQATPAGRANS